MRYDCKYCGIDNPSENKRCRFCNTFNGRFCLEPINTALSMLAVSKKEPFVSDYGYCYKALVDTHSMAAYWGVSLRQARRQMQKAAKAGAVDKMPFKHKNRNLWRVSEKLLGQMGFELAEGYYIVSKKI